MASPADLESLVEQRAETGVERGDHGRGRSVVVFAPGARDGVVGDHAQVEVPALAAFYEALARPRAHRQGGQTWRNAEALLRAAVRDVDTPPVDLDGNAAER